MTRRRWVYDPKLKEMVPIEEYDRDPEARIHILNEYQPYKSMKTGEMVEGRKAHREHLKRHNLTEIGDSFDKGLPPPKPIQSPPGLKEALARVVYEKLQYK